MSGVMTLTANAPGWGVLTCRGHCDGGPDSAIALRSNQSERFYHPDGQWRPLPHWFEPLQWHQTGTETRIQLGPDVISGVCAAPGQSVSILLKGEHEEHSYAVRIEGVLYGSILASPRPPPLDSSAVPTDLAPHRATVLEPSSPKASVEPNPPHPRNRFLLPVLAAFLVLVLAAGVFGVLPRPPEQPAQRASEPDDPWVQAERLEAQGQCDEARRLFLQLAANEPALQHRLAERFDPNRPRPPCEPDANVVRAENYYQRAVDAGVEEAQAPLGVLLVAPGRQAFDRQVGEQLLREAAARGDASAAAALGRLGTAR